jgi:uncharacterized protein (DUF1684 family)
MSDLNHFREEKNKFFRSHPQSPFTKEQKNEFNGLKYYPEDPSLRLEIAVEKSSDQQTVSIQTTGGTPQIYQRYGQFIFEVEGKEAKLTLYSSKDGYFLPFVDGLAGVETYPAGRYLEVEQLSNGNFLVDFNLAYNPYCAYNEQWSCPITPPENRLKAVIRAGEKIFHN